MRILHEEVESKMPLLSRSAVFNMSSASTEIPSLESRRLVVASGDEETYKVNIWDVNKGTLVQRLPAHSSAVIDIKHFGDISADFLGSVSEKQVRVYKLVQDVN